MRSLAVVAVLTSSCSLELPAPPPGSANGPTVAVEPVGTLELAPGVFRLRVSGGTGRSALSDYRFFSGELGAYHLGRIERRDLPATLAEREIPVLTWSEGRDVIVAPLRALETGKYACATPELGLVAEVSVDATVLPVLGRAWPPRDAPFGAGTAVFCGDAASGVAEVGVELEPTGVAASVLPGLDGARAFSDRCLRVEPDTVVAPGVPLLPPALVGNVSLEPSVLVVGDDGPEPVPCVAPELAFGPTCGAVEDDRIELHSHAAPAFVAFDAPRERFGVVLPGASLVLRGFEPASLTRMRGLAFDVLGARFRIDVDVRTSEARPHVVLNEILANPAGSEETGEWIELVNDGTESVDLDGFVLDDAIEPVALPAHVLAPGRMALLVADAYAPDPELDLVPPPDVPLVRVPRLGRSGLANAGELLRLRDRDGNVLSRFPARAAPGAGRSVARRSPDAPDGEAGSFGDHAEPGASPGGENLVD